MNTPTKEPLSRTLFNRGIHTNHDAVHLMRAAMEDILAGRITSRECNPKHRESW